jgi:hypothetical protein
MKRSVIFLVFAAIAAGNPRPASGSWDIGAYQYVAAPASNLLAVRR